MQIVYALEEAPRTYSKSIFLAGPSPRGDDTDNWREEAIALLDEAGYDGVVYVPLPRNGEWTRQYDHQIEWERKNLDRADVLLFWVPRDMERLPGLTTNIEFGTWYNSGRIALGHPLDAPHTRYLDHVARGEGTPLTYTLRDTVRAALHLLGEGAERTAGERDIPLIIWQKPEFQQWYKSQREAGNTLNGAKIVWTFRVGPMKTKVFLYALHVNVHITAEGRDKTNEVVIFRPDISTIVAYEDNGSRDFNEIRVVLIREFRSPASTATGMVHELPGGSSLKPDEAPEDVAAHEFEEETGFTVDASRFRYLGARQIAATLSAHRAHMFAIKLTPEEMAWFEAQAAAGQPRGVEDDTERTYIEVWTVEQLLRENVVDWSMLGMVFQALVR